MVEKEYHFLAQWRPVPGDDHPLNHWLTSMFEHWDPVLEQSRVQQFNSLAAAEAAIDQCPLDFGEYHILQVETTYTVVSTTTTGSWTGQPVNR